MAKKENTKNIQKKCGRKKIEKKKMLVDEFEDFDEMAEEIDSDVLGETLLHLADEVHDEVLGNALRAAVKRREKKTQPLSPESLVGKCLVYIGDSDNELYNQAVIYITESSAEQVRGIMINKLLFGTAAIECKGRENKTEVRNVYEDLYQGGPENPAHGVVIFPTQDNSAQDPFADVFGDVSVSTSFGVLQGILDGVGPTKKIIAMGHCLWHRGELEWEIFNNQWLIIPGSLKLMFDTNFADRWELAKKESGVYKGTYITPQIGLA